MADGNSDIGFARLCFVRHKDGIYAICCLVPQGTHTKVLKLSAGLRTQSVECSKLGKTRIITDASYGMVRNTGFCGQNLPPHVYLELTFKYLFPVILLIPPKRSMLIAAIPFLSEAYSSWIPLFSHACIISSGHREDCTSPMCALRRKNIQIRD